MSHYFVTNHTLKRVAGDFEHIDMFRMEDVWQELVIDGLKNFLSNPDGIALYTSKMLIESRLGRLKKRPKTFNSREVFSYTPPKFHAHENCEWMRSSYTNYEIPPQIKALGDKTVREFQVYCEDNKTQLQRLVDEGREDVFWMRVGTKFRVHGIQPQQILRNNSGLYAINNIDLRALEGMLYKKLDKLRELEKHPKHGRMVSKGKFGPSLERTRKALGIRQDQTEQISVLKKLFETIESLKRELTALYYKQAGLEVGMLPEEALVLAGIEPCRACCA